MKTRRGYTGVRTEQLDNSEKGKPDLKEILDIGYLNKSSLAKIQSRNKRHYLGENKWPTDDDKNLENSIEIYAENSARIAKNVLQLLAEGLGANGAFDDIFNEDALQVQRLTKYPIRNEIKEKEEGTD